MQSHYDRIVNDMQMMRNVESFVANIKREEEKRQDASLSNLIMTRAVQAGASCKKRRLMSNELNAGHEKDVDDSMMERAARFANGYDLSKYVGYLEHVPKTVNEVSRVFAEPIPGTGTTLPLNL